MRTHMKSVGPRGEERVLMSRDWTVTIVPSQGLERIMIMRWHKERAVNLLVRVEFGYRRK